MQRPSPFYLFAVIVAILCTGGVTRAQGIRLPTTTHVIVPDDLNALTSADAKIQGGIKFAPMGPGKITWFSNWSGPEDAVSWILAVPETDQYELRTIARGADAGSTVEVEIAGKKFAAQCGKGYARQVLGNATLPKGELTVTVRSGAGPPMRSLFAVELVRPSVRDDLAQRGEKTRAPTDWLANDKYGLMVHWTSQTKPRSGPAKKYQDAVRDFDVERFAQMVEDAGAKHVIFTTSHGGFYFPGPNRTIDSILPGRTCERDLVADLIKALNARGINLMLYYHPGHDDVPWWTRTHFDENKPEFFKQWIAIIQEIGERYGKGLAGFFFDDASFTYYPFNPPWEEMSRAAKAGNPDRIVMYNTWVLPKANDFYEVFAGESLFAPDALEGDGYLPAGGTGKFVGGPQTGLQAHLNMFLEDDWGHFKLDTPIGPPRISTEKLISGVQEAIRRKNALSLDVEIYQDGTISPQTLEMLKALKKVVR